VLHAPPAMMVAVPQLQELRSASQFVCLPHFIIMSCMVPMTLQQCMSMQGQAQSFTSGVTDLGTMLQVGRHHVTDCQRSVICMCVLVYISSDDHGAQTLSLVSGSIGYQHIWTHIVTLLSGSNISPSCCSRAIFRAAINRIIRGNNVVWL